MPTVLLALLALGGFFLLRGKGSDDLKALEGKKVTVGKSGTRWTTEAVSSSGGFTQVDVGVEMNALAARFGAHPAGKILTYRQTGSDKMSRILTRTFQGPEGSAIKWPQAVIDLCVKDFAVSTGAGLRH